jgi:hypothetical protein
MRNPLILSLLIATTPSLFAQSLTEKIDVSLVNVDVTVTSHGAPARGFTRDDFEVLEDWVTQNLTHFYAIENAREKTATSPDVAATQAAQPSPRDERFRRKVLVIIDNRHMSVHNRDVALRNLEKFINETHALRLRKGAPYRVVVAVHDQVSDAVGIRSTTVRF